MPTSLLLRCVVAFAISACGGSPANPKPAPKIVVTETVIELVDAITFVGDSVELAATSDRALDAIAATLLNTPEIRRVVVQVRVPDDGRAPEERAELAGKRASVVRGELIARDIAPARVDSEGLREPLPRPEADQVMFLVVERDPN